MKNVKFLFIALFIILPLQIFSQINEYPDRDSLVSDFNILVRYLEETHPDPYTGFGGRYFFHKNVREVKNQLLNNNYTVNKFIEVCSAFISNLNDQHTHLHLSNRDSHDKTARLNLSLEIEPDGLFVKGIARKYQDLIGCRIHKIGGLTLAQLVERSSAITAAENLYGNYFNLSNIVGNGNLLTIFPDLKDSLGIEFITPDNKMRHSWLPVTYSAEITDMAWRNETPVIDNDNNYLSYGFTDADKDIMYFINRSIMARENFRFMADNGWSGVEQQLRWVYQSFLNKPMPNGMDEAIAGIPSYSETFIEMLEQMKLHDTKNLIIDLRSNSGGWTPITLPTLYLLFGDDYLKTDLETEFSRRVSELLLEKQNMSLEQFNEWNGYNYQLGDFTFQATVPKQSILTQREEFINGSMSMVKGIMEAQNGEPFYRPDNIYVVTDAATFSAAFHYTYYLWKMGATVVGVPSRQAPNTYMESTPFQLPYTKANGSISNSIQIFLPPDDKRAKIFYPDLIPTWEDYKRYNFDKNTEVFYLIDYIRVK